MNKTRALAPSGALALTLMLAACGSSAPSGASTGSSKTAGTSPNGFVVKTVRAAGMSVLADASGLALYTPAQEASGKILCTSQSGCTSFWKPVTPAAATPRGPGGVGKLGVIKRPDGALQLTDNSRPLYTFVQDSAGQLHGNGFKDQFGGQHFTWHVVLNSGNPAGASGAANSGGAGAGASTSGGGYRSPY